MDCEVEAALVVHVGTICCAVPREKAGRDVVVTGVRRWLPELGRGEGNTHRFPEVAGEEVVSAVRVRLAEEVSETTS